MSHRDPPGVRLPMACDLRNFTALTQTQTFSSRLNNPRPTHPGERIDVRPPVQQRLHHVLPGVQHGKVQHREALLSAETARGSAV